MNLEHFKTYTTEDFIQDDEFRKIVRDSGRPERLINLMVNLPEKQQEIDLAIEVIRGLHVGKFEQPYQRKKELWHQIIQTQKREVRFQFFKIAASLLLLTGIGSAIFYNYEDKSSGKFIAAGLPPSDNATLILADGKAVSISSKQSTVHFSSDGSGIMVNDTSGLAQSVADDGLNQMIVPFGKRSFILLSEGTRVWLNSGSRLIFPPVFKGKTREVFLEGEAFFDVAKNSGKPFYVKTDAFKIKVYGTKFDVQAYAQDPDNSVVLVEGKISMNINNSKKMPEVFLVPNQKASLTKSNGNFGINSVENTEIYTAWVDGYLTFTNEEVADVLKRVSRYYNVEIEAELPDFTGKIYGKLDLKDDLERVLNGVAFISETKYEKIGNKYVFMVN